MSNKRSCPYKTLNGLDQLSGTSLVIDNITIQGPTSYPTYTLTLPPNDGSPGQILSTNGTGVLSWVNDSTSTGTVTSVSASVPAFMTVSVTNPTTTPNIAISASATGAGIIVLQTNPTFTDSYQVTCGTPGTGNLRFVSSGNFNFVMSGLNGTSGSTADLLFSDMGYANEWMRLTQVGYLGIGTAGPQEKLHVAGSAKVNDRILMDRNSGSGQAIRVHNSNPITDNYIEVGHNGNAGNHAHFGHYYIANNNPSNYAYISAHGTKLEWWGGFNLLKSANLTVQSDSILYLKAAGGAGTIRYDGLANFTFPITTGTAGQVLSTDGTGVTSWTNALSGVTSVGASSPITSSGGTTPIIGLTTVPTTLGGTGLTTIGTNGQVLTSNGLTLNWTTPTSGTVTSVTASTPISSSGGATPNITLSTVPTTLGGTGLTTVGTNGQVLASNGTILQYVTLPTPVTSVTATSPIVSSGGATPDLSLSTVPTTLGGTGLTTVGTNGQVLASNGTTLQYVTLPTPVTSVTATSPIVSSGGATPDLSLSTVPTTLGGTGLTTVGTSGQVLTSNGTTLSWQTPTTNPGTVTSVSASVPGLLSVTVSNPTSTPAIAIGYSGSALPTANGGTGLTTIGTAGQVLSSTGTGLQYVTLPTPVTSVTATSPIVSSGGATPDLSLSTVPTTLGGTGLTTVGTSGQVLTSNGTTLSWQTPSGGGSGTVTSVSASVPAFLSVTVNNPTTTPNIAISGTSTGTGSVVLQTSPTINNLLSITNPSTTFFNSIESYAPNLGTSHSNAIRFGKSSTTGEHGFLRYLQQATAATSSISLGLGSTQIAINGSGQFTVPGGILASNSWNLSLDNLIVSGTTTTLSLSSTTAAQFDSITSYAANLGNNLFNFFRIGKNSSSGEHGFLGYTAGATLSAKQVQLGIGSNVIALNQNAQCFIAGATLTTTQWTIPTSTSITSGGVLSVNNNTLVSSNFTNFSVLAPNLQTGVGIQIRLGTASVDNTGITFGWRTNTTTSSRYAYFETASVERLVINTGGNIGIGTSTPAQRLHLVGGRFRISDSVDTVIEMVAGAFTNFLYTASSNGNLVFDVGNRDHLIYCAKLWLIDNVPGGFEKGTINFNDDNHAIMGRFDNNNANVGSMNYYAFGEHRFLNNGLIASQTLKMTINTGGLVGINTAAPSYRLHVVDSNPDVTAMMENTVATGYAGIKLKTTTQECNVAVGGAASAVADKFYLFFNSSIRMVMNTSGDFGINTTTPTTKLDVNGSTRSTNFTTNGTQFFTYTEYVVPATNVIMLGSNYVAGTYGYDCVTFTSINPITYNDRYMKVTNIGQRVTITFRCNFSYVADPFPGFPGIVLLVNTSGAIQTRTNTYNTPEMYAQTIMHYPCSITGISNPMAASLFNITYAGSFYVGIFISTAVGTVNYNNTFGQSNQIIQGTITYNIL